MVDYDSSTYSRTRIIYNQSQVMRPEELQVGKTYVWWNRGEPLHIKYRVISVDMRRGVFLADEIFSGGFVHRDEFSMRDMGIIPCDIGFFLKELVWNRANCLVPK